MPWRDPGYSDLIRQTVDRLAIEADSDSVKTTGPWTISVSRELDTVWHIQDFASDVRSLKELLGRLGYVPKDGSSLSTAEADIAEMMACHEGKAIRDPAVDHRPAWRRAIGLADVARKILAVEGHPNFKQLHPLFELLIGNDEICLFTKTERENANNNKLFELIVGASLMAFMEDCELEDPNSGKHSNNPDFIGRWRGKRWGIACKALHSDNPKAAIDRIEEGISQIKRSGVDAGLVVLNAKNLIPHDGVWPATIKDGVWHYQAYANLEEVQNEFIAEFRNRNANILLKASGEDVDDNPDAKLAAAGRGRDVMLKLFSGTNAKPWMPIVWLTVVAQQTPDVGILAPAIFRFLTAFTLPREAADKETNDLCLLLSLAIQNLKPNEENLERARRAMGCS